MNPLIPNSDERPISPCHIKRVLMGVQLITNFSANCQLTTIFLANCQLTTNFSYLLTFIISQR